MSTRGRFFNENEAMKKNLTWKELQDGYKRLQAYFDEEDGLTRNRSGIGGELSELNKILSQMLNDRDDLRDRQNSVNTGSLKMKKTRGVSVEM